MYGMTEEAIPPYICRAKNKRGVTGEIFLQMLECRLDNVVYRLGFAKSRSAARQFVSHGHIAVNGKKTNISSFMVKGDEIEVRERTSSRQLATKYGGKSGKNCSRMVKPQHRCSKSNC